jgi:hypothetical protein
MFFTAFFLYDTKSLLLISNFGCWQQPFSNLGIDFPSCQLFEEKLFYAYIQIHKISAEYKISQFPLSARKN